ncbi:MAG: type I 3-dehydroquinate dehydratase, partial [Ignavibacteriae bacterium]|nr:type I 3-dehydroquinate dehydratase [Ignavibacteriota bacterium]
MIIVSVAGPSMNEALAQVEVSSRYADAFEFRLDLIKEPPLSFLLTSTRRPIIVSCRSAREGGRFDGSDAERLEILRAAVQIGVEYVDIELRDGQAIIDEFLESGVKVIVSHHQFEKRSVNPERIYAQLRQSGAHVLKFAYMAHDAAYIRYAIEFLRLARAERQKAIAVAMGECGEPTRILYRKFGGWATYASAEDAAPAAPGQLPASMMKKLFRSDQLTSGTKVFGVVGNPVRQSRGIFVHNPLFQRAGKNFVYCRFEVHNLAAFAQHVLPWLSGCSVTLPHKQSIMKYVDRVDATTKGIRAVNTIVRKRGKLFATNTDAPGALDAIEKISKVAGKRMLVLGAGGAARSIAYEAKRRGAHVLIANRTESVAKKLAQEFKITFVPHAELAKTE